MRTQSLSLSVACLIQIHLRILDKVLDEVLEKVLENNCWSLEKLSTSKVTGSS